jgi:hypothetical protein
MMERRSVEHLLWFKNIALLSYQYLIEELFEKMLFALVHIVLYVYGLLMTWMS